MEAGDEMRKFSHFFTFSPTVGIRYRATAQLVLVRVRLFPWPGILSVSWIHRLQKRPIFSPSFPSSLSLSSSRSSLPPSHSSSFLFCLPRFPPAPPPPFTQSYSRAVIKNISTPSSRFFSFLPFAIQTCTQFSVAPFLLPPIIPQAGRSGAKCDLNARKSGR